MGADLKPETTPQVLGCYSPCSKLTLRQWNNEIAEGDLLKDLSVLHWERSHQ